MLEQFVQHTSTDVKSDCIDNFKALFDAIEKHAITNSPYIFYHSRLSLSGCEEYEQLKKLTGQNKLEALLFLIGRTNELQNVIPNREYAPQSDQFLVSASLLEHVMRTKLIFPVDFSFAKLFEFMYAKKSTQDLSFRPFGALVTQMVKHHKEYGMTAQLADDIEFIMANKQVQRNTGSGTNQKSDGPDIVKAVKKLQLLVVGDSVLPYQFGSGRCGDMLAQDIEALPQESKEKWYKLFHHLATATSGKPSQKYSVQANLLVDDIGAKQFKSLANKWFVSLASLVVESHTKIHEYNGEQYSYETHEYIESYSHNLLKGLLWSMSRFHDKQSLQNIATLTEKCFQKIPGVGPAAAAVGNAGIYALAQSKGLAGISHLSRLKLRIRQNNTQKLIGQYIEAQAENLGLLPAQVEEIAAPDFAMTDGKLVEHFDDYQLVLRMTGIGTTELQWIKPDGKLQKSVPAFVKNKAKLADKLKKVQALAKQIKQASTAQRDRIDRLYIENLKWSLADFKKYYLEHGLVGQIAQKLIWTMDGQSALFVDGHWQDEQGRTVSVNEQTQVHLWHPIESKPETVLAWRDRLYDLSIQQPMKQAYREVYLLTDAEIHTRIYSNRMAAHILKQHQFNSLAALRGWKYSLLGAYDDGREGEIAQKPLPACKMTAQFWINEILDDSESFNDAGIWNYIATDQVRFCDEAQQPVALVDVDPLILSEIMRDVDLFVGVASVGNDPQWQDGGPDARTDYRDYWYGYSFGALTELAKTRKAVLERLLPRLKLRDIATINGKFLHVQGKKNLYKIHIGSGNILIAPNDRYLCIVPSRGKDKKVEQVFLPFEGDNGLSIVLSKAFMLADDDKITDPTILSQL